MVFLERTDFQFNILYEEPGGGEKRYLPEGDQAGVPLLTLVNLDRLNNQNDPQPDGVFDYVEGYTVVSPQSRIVFPVLEPFGSDLEYAFTSNPSLRDKYLYLPACMIPSRPLRKLMLTLTGYIFRGTARTSRNRWRYSAECIQYTTGICYRNCRWTSAAGKY